MRTLSKHEKIIMIAAITAADCFGMGRLTASKTEILDAGYQWDEANEKFCFDFDPNEDMPIKKIPCELCNGRGTIPGTIDSLDPRASMCPKCKGEGEL